MSENIFDMSEMQILSKYKGKKFFNHENEEFVLISDFIYYADKSCRIVLSEGFYGKIKYRHFENDNDLFKFLTGLSIEKHKTVETKNQNMTSNATPGPDSENEKLQQESSLQKITEIMLTALDDFSNNKIDLDRAVGFCKICQTILNIEKFKSNTK